MATPALRGIPRYIFTVFEPITLIAGWYSATFSVDYFLQEQIPGASFYSPRSFLPQSTNAKVVAYQLGNLYLLSALFAVFVLRQSSDAQLVRNSLFCLAVADLGHVASSYVGLGSARFFDVGGWNAVAWGNIAVTTFLFISRIAYFLGLFSAGSRTKGKTKVR